MNDENEFENVVVEENSTSNTTTENETVDNNTTENTTTEIIVNLDESEQLQLIHEDLGIICSFIIFFVLVILLRYTYKFFSMFFPI